MKPLIEDSSTTIRLKIFSIHGRKIKIQNIIKHMIYASQSFRLTIWSDIFHVSITLSAFRVNFSNEIPRIKRILYMWYLTNLSTHSITLSRDSSTHHLDSSTFAFFVAGVVIFSFADLSSFGRFKEDGFLFPYLSTLSLRLYSGSLLIVIYS